MFEHTLTTLSSGLPVLRIPMPGVKSLTCLVLANTGSRYEEPGQAGIAHFFEHIVFKGTEKYSSPQVLAAEIDAIGAEFNAFTSKEYTGYYVKADSKQAHVALDVLSDMLLVPAVRQEDVDREKGVIIEEINMYRDMPMHHIANLFEQMFYAEYGLQHDIVGTKETVSSITSQNFRDFLARWYGLPNLLLIVAGDSDVVNGAGFERELEQFFSKRPSEERITDKADATAFLGAQPISEKRLHLEVRKTDQAHLILGWPGLKRGTTERHALSLLSVILGGNMSSRLFSEVREKRGLCYYVRSDVDYYRETGMVGASAGVDPNRVSEAISVIMDECAAIAGGARPVTADELQRAKDYVRGTMTLSLEDSKSVAQYFGMQSLLLDKIDSPEETMRIIAAVELDEVRELAKKLFASQPPKLGVIGPFEGKEQEFAGLIG